MHTLTYNTTPPDASERVFPKSIRHVEDTLGGKGLNYLLALSEPTAGSCCDNRLF